MADNTQGRSWNPVTLRRGVLGAACIETALIFFAIHASTAGQGTMTRAAAVALATFFLLVLPAWLLAWSNRALGLAVALAAVAGIVCVALLAMAI